MPVILLLPDVRDWAFDNIAKGIVKYNPFPDLTYEIKYVGDYVTPTHRTELDVSAYDLVYDFFWGNDIVRDYSKLVKGCYSARWIQWGKGPEQAATALATAKAIVFSLEIFRDQVIAEMANKPRTLVIPDSADTEYFYPEDGKSAEFSVAFVGRTTDAIKQYDKIVECCATAGVELETHMDTPHQELRAVYNRVHAVVNFSLAEGGPQVFAEAALCGTPMVMKQGVGLSTRAPAITVSDAEGLVHTLQVMKEDHGICVRKGKEVKAYALEHLNYKVAAKNFGQYFKSILEGKP